MTYIEFFDKTATENIAACLTYAPERVIFIGDNSRLMKKHIENYKTVFLNRGQNIEFLFKTTSKSNLENAVKLITEIVEEYENCVFDITGGEEILLLALGIVYERYPEKNIQIHRFNLNNNSVSDCDKDGVTIYRNTPELSIEENIRLYGGDILYGGVDEENTYRWELTHDFINDVNRIWDVCKNNVRLWNTQIGLFEAIEKAGEADGMTTSASISAVEYHLSRVKAKYKPVMGIINCLIKYGLLTGFDDSDEKTVKISYKDPQVKKCLTKAGQALEMKIYTLALSACDTQGKHVYNDAMNGVVIDWDGKFHDEEKEAFYDTENEIDILLMHNAIPVFVSCKNGIVTADELYKLSTVAHRFGSTYSKKVLITTSLSCLGDSGEYIRARADEMGIKIIDGVQNMSEVELERNLRNLWNGN